MSTKSYFDAQLSTPNRPLPSWFRLIQRWAVPTDAVIAPLLPGGKRALEIGAGEGTLATKLAERYEKVIATDLSDVACERLRERLATEGAVSVMTLDANQALPFPDAHFDAIVAVSVLQYLFDPEVLLKEAARVLVPNGRLVIEVSNLAYLPQRLRLLFGRPPLTSYYAHGIDGGNLHYFTVDLLRELVERAGFTIETVSNSGVLASVRRVHVPLLSGDIILVARKG